MFARIPCLALVLASVASSSFAASPLESLFVRQATQSGDEVTVTYSLPAGYEFVGVESRVYSCKDSEFSGTKVDTFFVGYRVIGRAIAPEANAGPAREMTTTFHLAELSRSSEVITYAGTLKQAFKDPDAAGFLKNIAPCREAK